MAPLIRRIVDLLIAWRWPLLAVAAVIAALAWWPSRQVRFDRSVENMFAADDPLLPPYQRLKRDFGGNEIVMAVYQDPNLMAADGSGLKRLATLSGQMKQVASVRDVLSLAQVNDLLEKLQQGKKAANLFNLFGGKKEEEPWTGPAILNPNDPLATRYRELFSGYTHSADGQTAAVVCMLEPEGSHHAPRDEAPHAEREVYQDPRQRTIYELQKIISALPKDLSPGVLAGEPVMVVEGFSLLEEDGRRLGTWTTLLLGLTILACFRSLRWLVVPIVVVQWTLLVTRATLVLSGLHLSMVSSMLTAIVTVVGVASVTHLIVHYRELRAGGLMPRDALHKTCILLTSAIFGAILTDAAGFGSLWWASVGPVRDFGTMMVVGALMVMPAICLLVPGLALLGARDTGPTKPGWGEGQLGLWLLRSVDMIHARPKTVAIVAVIGSLIAGLGAMRLEVETDFTRNFRPGNRVVTSYEFVETRLGGAGVWDVIIPAPATLDKAYLARVRRLEERLREIRIPGSGVVRGRDSAMAQSLVPRSTPDPLQVAQRIISSDGRSTRIVNAGVESRATSKGSGVDGENRSAAIEGDRSPTTPDPANQESGGTPTRSVSEGDARLPAPALTKVISLVDALDAVDVDPMLAALTPSPELRAQTMAAMMPTFMGALRSTELNEHGEGRLRIMLRSHERQPAEQKRRLIEEVTRLAQEEFPPSSHHAPHDEAPHAEREDYHAGAEVTGFFVLLTNIIESMLRDQWVTFGISMTAISLMVWIGFRSWKYALISLIPNAVPIYVVMGLMGWINLLGIADLKINMGSAMIAAVSMGMSVDSSIHYFAAFRRARREGKSVHASLLEVQQSVGTAMIVTTAALIMGFGVLVTSEFVPTIYFGALMSLAMLGGLFGNLLVLPLLLAWVEREPIPTRRASEGNGSPTPTDANDENDVNVAAIASAPLQTPTAAAGASPDRTPPTGPAPEPPLADR